MFFNLLGDANDDLDRAILQPHENHRAHATGNVSRCSVEQQPCLEFAFCNLDVCNHGPREVLAVASR